jgi:hypothetical protein
MAVRRFSFAVIDPIVIFEVDSVGRRYSQRQTVARITRNRLPEQLKCLGDVFPLVPNEPGPGRASMGERDAAVRRMIIPSNRASYNIPHQHGLLLLATRNGQAIQSSFHERPQSPSLCSDHIGYTFLTRI